jgi:hypothetical protein
MCMRLTCPPSPALPSHPHLAVRLQAQVGREQRVARPAGPAAAAPALPRREPPGGRELVDQLGLERLQKDGLPRGRRPRRERLEESIGLHARSKALLLLTHCELCMQQAPRSRAPDGGQGAWCGAVIRATCLGNGIFTINTTYCWQWGLGWRLARPCRVPKVPCALPNFHEQLPAQLDAAGNKYVGWLLHR